MHGFSKFKVKTSKRHEEPWKSCNASEGIVIIVKDYDKIKTFWV